MSDFKLKIVIGDAQIELEGEGELVHTIFQEIKDSGLGKFTSLVQDGHKDAVRPSATSPSDANKGVSDSSEESSAPKLPLLQDVVLQGKPKTEVEWLLIYAAYASNWGSNLFTREDLRVKYTETKRITPTRNKNFATNFKSLSIAQYISANNDTEYRLTQMGVQKAKDIVLGESPSKKANKPAGSTSKRTLSTYKIVDIGLSSEDRIQFKDFWIQHDHTSNMNKAVLAAYWLKSKKSVVDFTADHLFTMLRTIEESASFDLLSAIKNAKKDKSYFILGSAKGSYTLTHIGEDHVKLLEISQKEDK